MGKMSYEWEETSSSSSSYANSDRPAASFSEALEAFRSSYPGSSQERYPAEGNTAGKDERPPALSVSAAMSLAKGALENVTVRLIGEVSEVSNKAGYKAVYFTVKDEGAALPCMMWTSRYRASGVELAVGNLVELSGRFTLYAAKGRMNFDVFSIAIAGEGDLRMRVAAIARKLEAEGLTSPARKRALPELPQVIGLVTSPRGAAVHDVLRTLRRRYPLARVCLAGVPVEGANAPAGLVEGIATVVRAGAEVVLVVRGGGSFEDLMPFNDERLARTIAVCPVPVVTGIGHEPDTTIADMVSDRRASTPTAAAEAVSPGMDVLSQRVLSQGVRMHDVLSRRLMLSARFLEAKASRPVMCNPSILLAGWVQGVDERADRLGRALPAALERDCVSLENSKKRLATYGAGFGRGFEGRLAANRAALLSGVSRLTVESQAKTDAASSRLLSLGASLTGRFQSELALSASRLEDLSPLAVLARGYAIARGQDGAVVKSVGQVGAGDNVLVTVSDGTLACRVISSVANEDRNQARLSADE